MRSLSRSRRELAIAFSVTVHVGLLAALITARMETPKPYEPILMTVQLVEPPPRVQPSPEPTPDPKPAKTPQRKNAFRKAPPPPEVEPMPAGEDHVVRQGVEVSDSELAGAATAGNGNAGGACNMPLLIEKALRKNTLVRSAVARADHGKAIKIWGGDWVRRPDQEGEGLAAVREAVMWEVGFAPEACRSQRMRGLVLISLDDTPGAARLVIGDDDWRWSDMLYARSTRR
ncbi:hypothetical protein [Phenylobacterium sp.]|uniref:hypothetical protein n=1 Tax=Phenylobacterium sp. TaxID=1871053 RepID=UPI0035B290EA